MKLSIPTLPPLMMLALITAFPASAQDLDERIIHNDPDNYREFSSAHDGAGPMEFTEMIGRQDLSTNFLYLHAGRILPRGGIGHHFHHRIEEMYVLLSGEAEFTINGHTSRLEAPVVVPNKMGDSHALYNPTDEPLRWLNFAVSKEKGQGDAFDLGDDRVGATVDPVPVFVYSHLEQDPSAGGGVRHDRTLGPEVFSTDWNHVDHIVITSGNATEPRQLEGVEEVYYVIDGSGTITIEDRTASIGTDDAFPVSMGETISIANNESEDLELLVIGIAASPQKHTDVPEPPSEPTAMVLQMDFVIAEENREAFEELYYSIYVPAMKVQPGYLNSSLLRLYPEEEAAEIEAESTDYNYQIKISFDTEENRRRWQASDQHQIAWPAATDLAEEFKWRGYDLLGSDHQH